MYPNSIYMGLKVLPIWVHWAPRIYYLGTWTLRVGTPSLGLGHAVTKKSSAVDWSFNKLSPLRL